MILGHLADIETQTAVLPPAIAKGIKALQTLDLLKIAPGRYAIDGDALFYIVEDATPRAVADCHPEAHRDYADVQIPISVTERFGFALPQAGIAPVEEFFGSRDLGFYAKPANEFFLDVEPGSYIVFLPGELHRPCVQITDPAPFRKVVIKVHRDLLGL